MHKAGFVNIVGNPNVGKSTLMNLFMGERISIATFKAQTTRHRIMGIINSDDAHGAVARGLGLGGYDGHALADEVVHQRRLADVRVAYDVDETGAVPGFCFRVFHYTVFYVSLSKFFGCSGADTTVVYLKTKIAQ